MWLDPGALAVLSGFVLPSFRLTVFQISFILCDSLKQSPKTGIIIIPILHRGKTRPQESEVIYSSRRGCLGDPGLTPPSLMLLTTLMGTSCWW